MFASTTPRIRRRGNPPTFTHARRNDWGVRWIEFIKDSMDLAPELKLDWDSEGITCTSWCGDGIEVLTGVNPFDAYRGEFTNALGACKAIRKRGFQTLDELIESMFMEIPVTHVQQGDLCCLLPHWNAAPPQVETFYVEVMPHAIALADPPHFWAVTEEGLGRGDLYAEAVRAFAVGRPI